MLKLLGNLSEVEGDKRDKEVKTFTDAINDIKRVGDRPTVHWKP